MTSPDEEFDDFLRRHRPVFRRDDELEPPAEIDRLVLRRARDAIEGDRPQRVFRAPAWGMPVALAATLVLAFTIILRVGTTQVAKTPEVTVQNVSRQIEMPQAAAPPPAADMARGPAKAQTQPVQENDSGAIVVDLAAGGARAAAETTADTNAAPAAELRARRLEKRADVAAPTRDAGSEAMVAQSTVAAPMAAAASKPEYRRDSKSWLAEIERLRATGDAVRADAELAEYKREHRAYAVAPDR